MIELADVSKIFQGKGCQVKACEHINFSVQKGDIFGVVGYSGAGKSTLLRMVNALETPTTGRVTVNGEIISELSGAALRQARKHIAMIFQNFNLLHSKTVFENVAMPLLLNAVPAAAIRERVREVLRFVDLENKADVYPDQLSGGQKQRVGIARALTTNPDILLCDEPTSALDPQTTESILQVLQKVNQELGVTIMIITHQIRIVHKICNKVAVMADGKIVEMGLVPEVFSRPHEEITRNFVGTVVDEKIPQTILAAALQEKKPFRIMKVRCLNGNVCDIFVPTLRQQFAVEIRTLFVSVTEMQGAVLTVIALQLVGSIEQLQAVSVYLEAHYECQEVAA